MNLVACEAPAGALDDAPLSGLRQDTPTETWAGFWGADDLYYARCTSPAGRVGWYRLVDAPESALSPVQAMRPDAPVPAAVPTASARLLFLFRVGPSASHGCMIGVRHATRRSLAKTSVVTTAASTVSTGTSTGRADRVRSADMRA